MNDETDDGQSENRCMDNMLLLNVEKNPTKINSNLVG